MKMTGPAAVAMALCSVASGVSADASFAKFDQRAREGERLNVVFFGASLTWGANASDQALTSCRARVAERLEQEYPKAHFKFFDAAIGGTGSQLGVFRLDRDVRSRKPDLVFLDFSANDDIWSDSIEENASYESLLRRIIRDGRCLVVLMVFPFRDNVEHGNTNGMKRRDAHLAMAGAYGAAVGDAIVLAQARVRAGQMTLDALWPYDPVHPGDAGYALFADAAWQGYQGAVRRRLACRVPKKMLYPATYMANQRARLAKLFGGKHLPEGWRVGTPSLTAAWHDGLMSRWLDDVLIASNRRQGKGADGKESSVAVMPAPLKVRFSGSMVLLYGEETVKSGRYRVRLDGRAVTYTPWGAQAPTDLYDASSKRFGGNRQHAQLIATRLDPAQDHTLEIEPVLDGGEELELRLESVCVAGGKACVEPAGSAATPTPGPTPQNGRNQGETSRGGAEFAEGEGSI